MLRLVSVLAAVAVGATTVYGKSAAIDARKDSFKAMAGSAKEPAAMFKGDAKFEISKVHAALRTYQEKAIKLKTLFPEDSRSGNTDALANIWTDKASFTQRFDKLSADAKTAEAVIKDERSFKTEWPKVMGNCGACHKEYRKPQT